MLVDANVIRGTFHKNFMGSKLKFWKKSFFVFTYDSSDLIGSQIASQDSWAVVTSAKL